MYASSLGLQHAPFPEPNARPAPQLSARHSEALARLLLTLQGDAAVVLVTADDLRCGDEAARYLSDHAPHNCQAARVHAQGSTAIDSLRAVCAALHLPKPPADLDAPALSAVVQTLLQKADNDGKHNLLIVERAHRCSDEALLSIVQLAQAEADAGRLLQLVLVGSPELIQRLGQPTLKTLGAHIGQQVHLPPLDLTETTTYIVLRMQAAGWKGAVPFTDKAVQQVQTLSGGLPTRIDALCHQALQLMQTRQKKAVDHKLVNAAAAAMQHGAANAPASSPAAAAAAPTRAGRSLDTRLSALTSRAPLWTWLAGASVALGLLAGGFWWLWPANVTPEPDSQAVQGAVDHAPRLTTAAALNISPVASRPETKAPNAGPAEPAERMPDVEPPSINPVDTPTDAEGPNLATLSDDPSEIWPALGRLWGISLDGRQSCDKAQRQGLQCFRSRDIGLTELRGIGRPGLVQLTDGQVQRWVLLRALDPTAVTLTSGQLRWRVPLAQFQQQWTGAHTTLWRLPPGYSNRVFTANTDDAAGRWMNERLKRLQAQKQLPATPDNFEARVALFQKLQKLPGDGKALPSTFMRLNRVLGVQEPRL